MLSGSGHSTLIHFDSAASNEASTSRANVHVAAFDELSTVTFDSRGAVHAAVSFEASRIQPIVCFSHSGARRGLLRGLDLVIRAAHRQRAVLILLGQWRSIRLAMLRLLARHHADERLRV